MRREGNRLAGEKSPYLLQHAGNPVDWYPWGEEAFARARELDRPIFLSIGYSTCHWCHVMERESFEDPEVARLLNEGFISIKVDREERPDVDALYMMVCQLLTGSGGWPLTVVLTPDRRPFFAGTYFPRTGRYGRTGMVDLLPRLRQLWEERREDVQRSAEEITAAVARAARPDGSGEPGAGPGLETAERAVRLLERTFDPHQGGFGGAPRFPTPHQLIFLLRWWSRTRGEKALTMAETTLGAMRRGGLWDHIGFGFHRYSTDARWLVPHFEKMLYDQALHVLAYSEAWLATGRAGYRRTAEQTIAYVLRDLTGAEGAFLSAEDADSEGEEGRFYLWEASELDALLGEASELVKRVWNVEVRGNYADEATGTRTGRNIFHLRRELPELADELGLPADELEGRLEAARRVLFEARERRVRPHRDDKVLTDWNGLMIGALAVAARIFGEPAYAAAARRAAEFLLAELRDREGRLLHRWREGEAAVTGTAEDHAFLGWGLLRLYEAELEPRWLREALALARGLVERFRDPEGGGLFSTASDAEPLPVRLKESYDGAIPSANSVAMELFLRLSRLTGQTELEERAAEIPRAFAALVRAAPTGHTWMLSALDLAIGPSTEVVLVGEPGAADTRELLEVLRRTYAPRAVTLLVPPGDEGREVRELAPFTREFGPVDGRAAVFVCRDHTCDLPTSDPEELRRRLEAVR